MRIYISNYINELENKINNKYAFKDKDIKLIREKINDFNHERLIHLLVTLFYALITIIFLALGFISIIFIIPFFILIIFLLFYIRHYFFLENKIHYLYSLYDKIIS